MPKSSTFAAIAITTAAVAVTAYGYYSAKQRSLKAGVIQTTQALEHIDELVDENQRDAAQLFRRIGIDAGGALDKLGGDPHLLGDAIDLWGEATSSYEGTSNIQERNYATGIQKTAEAIAGLWSLWNPEVGFGKALVDVTADTYEAQSILNQQAQLLVARHNLEVQLARLQGKELEEENDWGDISQKLRRDPTSNRAAFNHWLQAHGIAKKDLVEALLSRPVALAGAGVALGNLGLDQSDKCGLLSIPGINPDFVRMLNKEEAYLRGGNYMAAQAVTFSSFGTHISPFGPASGTELTYETVAGQEYITGPHPVGPDTSCSAPRNATLDIKAGSKALAPEGNAMGEPNKQSEEIGGEDGSIIYFPSSRYRDGKTSITVRFLNSSAKRTHEPSLYASHGGRYIDTENVGGTGMKIIYRRDGSEDNDENITSARWSFGGGLTGTALEPGIYKVYICPEGSGGIYRGTRTGSSEAWHCIGSDQHTNIDPARVLTVNLHAPDHDIAVVTIIR